MEQTITKIPMPVVDDYFVLYRSEVINKAFTAIIMIPITEDEERTLDKIKDNPITIWRGDIQKGVLKFVIEPKSIYCYGIVDLNTDSDDYNMIEDNPIFNFLDSLGAVGVKIPSDYNYNEHVCNTPISRCRWTETWNPAQLAQYAHGCLGKPERILLFKHVVNK